MDNLARRNFLGFLAGALAAPAIIRTPGLLMPIKPSLVPAGDGITLTSISHPEHLVVRSSGACTFTIKGTNVYGEPVVETIQLTNGMQYTRMQLQRVLSIRADSAFYDSQPIVEGCFSGEKYSIIETAPLHGDSYLDVKNNPYGPATVVPLPTGLHKFNGKNVDEFMKTSKWNGMIDSNLGIQDTIHGKDFVTAYKNNESYINARFAAT